MSRNFVVGIFVTLGLAGLLTAAVWLTGTRSSEPMTDYSMFFDTDVGGLMLGGPVYFLGVEVGTVTAMEIIPGDPMRVRIDARIRKSVPVNAGTYASLSFQGITGVAVIKLNADPGEHGPLQKMPGSRFPVIAVRDTGFSALLAKAPGIVERLDSVLLQINELLGQENRRFVSGMLADLADVSHALAANEAAIAELPGLLKSALEELNSGLAQLRSVAGGIEPELTATAANLQDATQNLARAAGRLEAWMAENDAGMDAFLGDGLGQFPALVSEARTALREIEKLVRELRQDPSRLIYQPKEEVVRDKR